MTKSFANRSRSSRVTMPHAGHTLALPCEMQTLNLRCRLSHTCPKRKNHVHFEVNFNFDGTCPPHAIAASIISASAMHERNGTPVRNALMCRSTERCIAVHTRKRAHRHTHFSSTHVPTAITRMLKEPCIATASSNHDIAVLSFLHGSNFVSALFLELCTTKKGPASNVHHCCSQLSSRLKLCTCSLL